MKWTHVVGLALVLAGILAGLTVYKKSLTPYRSFDEAMKTDAVVQVHGKLTPGQASYDGKLLRFTLQEETGRRMDVVYAEVKPGNFDQARDVVAVGQWKGDAFHAQKLLIKCPSKYQEMQEKQAPNPGATT